MPIRACACSKSALSNFTLGTHMNVLVYLKSKHFGYICLYVHVHAAKALWTTSHPLDFFSMNNFFNMCVCMDVCIHMQ